MKSLLIVFLFVLQHDALVSLKLSPLKRDSPLLMKILQSVDVAANDEHLFDVTLKLLRSLCVCMRETLRQKEDTLVFNGDTSTLQTEDSLSTVRKDLEIYRKIYNNTCLNLRQELANKIRKTHAVSIEEDDLLFDHSNCGKYEDNKTRNIKKNTRRSLKDNLKYSLENILYKALIQTKDVHKYQLKRHYLFGKIKHPIYSLRHSVIVIITLHPIYFKGINETNKNDINEKELHGVFNSNSSIDIDIYDAKYDTKAKESQEKETDSVLDCNLYSIYTFLIESEKKNLTKVFKILRKADTIKIYIDVTTLRNHTDYSSICCNNGTTSLCKKHLINNNVESAEFKVNYIKRRQTIGNYKDTITKIKKLVELYDKKIIDGSSLTMNDINENIRQDDIVEPELLGVDSLDTTLPIFRIKNNTNAEANDMQTKIYTIESSIAENTTKAGLFFNYFQNKTTNFERNQLQSITEGSKIASRLNELSNNNSHSKEWLTTSTPFRDNDSSNKINIKKLSLITSSTQKNMQYELNPKLIKNELSTLLPYKQTIQQKHENQWNAKKYQDIIFVSPTNETTKSQFLFKTTTSDRNYQIDKDYSFSQIKGKTLAVNISNHVKRNGLSLESLGSPSTTMFPSDFYLDKDKTIKDYLPSRQITEVLSMPKYSNSMKPAATFVTRHNFSKLYTNFNITNSQPLTTLRHTINLSGLQNIQVIEQEKENNNIINVKYMNDSKNMFATSFDNSLKTYNNTPFSTSSVRITSTGQAPNITKVFEQKIQTSKGKAINVLSFTLKSDPIKNNNNSKTEVGTEPKNNTKNVTRDLDKQQPSINKLPDEASDVLQLTTNINFTTNNYGTSTTPNISTLGNMKTTHEITINTENASLTYINALKQTLKGLNNYSTKADIDSKTNSTNTAFIISKYIDAITSPLTANNDIIIEATTDNAAIFTRTTSSLNITPSLSDPQTNSNDVFAASKIIMMISESIIKFKVKSTTDVVGYTDCPKEWEIFGKNKNTTKPYNSTVQPMVNNEKRKATIQPPVQIHDILGNQGLQIANKTEASANYLKIDKLYQDISQTIRISESSSSLWTVKIGTSTTIKPTLQIRQSTLTRKERISVTQALELPQNNKYTENSIYSTIPNFVVENSSKTLSTRFSSKSEKNQYDPFIYHNTIQGQNLIHYNSEIPKNSSTPKHVIEKQTIFSTFNNENHRTIIEETTTNKLEVFPKSVIEEILNNTTTSFIRSTNEKKQAKHDITNARFTVIPVTHYLLEPTIQLNEKNNKSVRRQEVHLKFISNITTDNGDVKQVTSSTAPWKSLGFKIKTIFPSSTATDLEVLQLPEIPSVIETIIEKPEYMPNTNINLKNVTVKTDLNGTIKVTQTTKNVVPISINNFIGTKPLAFNLSPRKTTAYTTRRKFAKYLTEISTENTRLKELNTDTNVYENTDKNVIVHPNVTQINIINNKNEMHHSPYIPLNNIMDHVIRSQKEQSAVSKSEQIPTIKDQLPTSKTINKTISGSSYILKNKSLGSILLEGNKSAIIERNNLKIKKIKEDFNSSSIKEEITLRGVLNEKVTPRMMFTTFTLISEPTVKPKSVTNLYVLSKPNSINVSKNTNAVTNTPSSKNSESDLIHKLTAKTIRNNLNLQTKLPSLIYTSKASKINELDEETYKITDVNKFTKKDATTTKKIKSLHNVVTTSVTKTGTLFPVKHSNSSNLFLLKVDYDKIDSKLKNHMTNMLIDSSIFKTTIWPNRYGSQTDVKTNANHIKPYSNADINISGRPTEMPLTECFNMKPRWNDIILTDAVTQDTFTNKYNYTKNKEIKSFVQHKDDTFNSTFPNNTFKTQNKLDDPRKDAFIQALTGNPYSESDFTENVVKTESVSSQPNINNIRTSEETIHFGTFAKNDSIPASYSKNVMQEFSIAKNNNTNQVVSNAILTIKRKPQENTKVECSQKNTTADKSDKSSKITSPPIMIPSSSITNNTCNGEQEIENTTQTIQWNNPFILEKSPLKRFNKLNANITMDKSQIEIIQNETLREKKIALLVSLDKAIERLPHNTLTIKYVDSFIAKENTQKPIVGNDVTTFGATSFLKPKSDDITKMSAKTSINNFKKINGGVSDKNLERVEEDIKVKNLIFDTPTTNIAIFTGASKITKTTSNLLHDLVDLGPLSHTILPNNSLKIKTANVNILEKQNAASILTKPLHKNYELTESLNYQYKNAYNRFSTYDGKNKKPERFSQYLPSLEINTTGTTSAFMFNKTTVSDNILLTTTYYYKMPKHQLHKINVLNMTENLQSKSNSNKIYTKNLTAFTTTPQTITKIVIRNTSSKSMKSNDKNQKYFSKQNIENNSNMVPNIYKNNDIFPTNITKTNENLLIRRHQKDTLNINDSNITNKPSDLNLISEKSNFIFYSKNNINNISQSTRVHEKTIGDSHIKTKFKNSEKLIQTPPTHLPILLYHIYSNQNKNMDGKPTKTIEINNIKLENKRLNKHVYKINFAAVTTKDNLNNNAFTTKKFPSSSARNITLKNKHDISVKPSRLTTTKTSKTIKYNTYKPNTEDEFDLSLKYETLLDRNKANYYKNHPQNVSKKTDNHVTSCAFLRNLSFKSNKSLQELLKAGNCTKGSNTMLNFENNQNGNKHSFKDIKNSSKLNPNKVSLLDPFAKTYLYPIKRVPPKIQRKVMKRIRLNNRKKELITINRNDLFTQRRFLPQRNIMKEIAAPHLRPLIRKAVTSIPRHRMLKPKFETIDDSNANHKGRFRPKPLYIQNDNDFYKEDFEAHHRPSGITWREKVNYVQEALKQFTPNTRQKYENVIEKPSYTHAITKPKFLRDRIDSIRNYLYNADFVKSTETNSEQPHFKPQKDDDNSDEEYNNPSDFHFKNNGVTEKTTTITTTSKVIRRGRTLFFLSPTVPYNRYF